MGQDEEGQQLNLKIRGGDGEEVVFKVKKTTAFSKIFTAYCQRKGVQIQACRFVDQKIESNCRLVDPIPYDPIESNCRLVVQFS